MPGEWLFCVEDRAANQKCTAVYIISVCMNCNGLLWILEICAAAIYTSDKLVRET